MINQQWIDQQRKVCEAATPGPWVTTGSCGHIVDAPSLTFKGISVRSIVGEMYGAPSNNRQQAAMDAKFVAAARTGWPTSLDALEAANAEIARLTAERGAEKCRADAAVNDLKKICMLAIDDGADCACCTCCKHSRGTPPLGSTDDCDLLRYDDETDEIIGECKWEWNNPCAENAPEGAESEGEQ